MEPRRYRIKLWGEENQRWEFYLSHRLLAFGTKAEISSSPSQGTEWPNIVAAHARLQTVREFVRLAEIDPIW